MYSNIDRALFEIEVILAGVLRAGGKVDLHDNSRELAYRTGMVKRFSPTTSASASDRSMESARRKLSFESGVTDEGLAYWGGEGLCSFHSCHPR